jgi:hypothetical protein
MTVMHAYRASAHSSVENTTHSDEQYISVELLDPESSCTENTREYDFYSPGMAIYEVLGAVCGDSSDAHHQTSRNAKIVVHGRAIGDVRIGLGKRARRKTPPVDHTPVFAGCQAVNETDFWRWWGYSRGC